MTVLGSVVEKCIGAVDTLCAGLRGRETIESFDVFGRQEFRRAVAQALPLLRDKKLPAWDTLTQHVGSLIEGTRTTAIVTARPAFMFVDKRYWRNAPEFLAAAIAYMARSVELHRIHEVEFPGRRIPQDMYAGSGAEELCKTAYYECLLALGKGGEPTQGPKAPTHGKGGATP